jgi:hypothetical protein
MITWPVVRRRQKFWSCGDMKADWSVCTAPVLSPSIGGGGGSAICSSRFRVQTTRTSS